MRNEFCGTCKHFNRSQLKHEEEVLINGDFWEEDRCLCMKDNRYHHELEYSCDEYEGEKKCTALNITSTVITW